MSKLIARPVIIISALATLAAAWFAPSAGDDAVVLSPRVQNNRSQTVDRAVTGPAITPVDSDGGKSGVHVLSIYSRELVAADDATGERLFAETESERPHATSVTKPRVAPPASAPVQPQAPPLPFKILGRYEEAGMQVFFLQYSEKTMPVRVGENIDEVYKVESYQGTALNIRYLPMNLVQQLEVGPSP